MSGISREMNLRGLTPRTFFYTDRFNDDYTLFADNVSMQI